MSRSGILILLGVLTILAPFSGLPVSMRSFLAIVFGAGVVIVALMMRSSEARGKREPVLEAVAAETPEEAPQESTATGPRGVSPI